MSKLNHEETIESRQDIQRSTSPENTEQRSKDWSEADLEDPRIQDRFLREVGIDPNLENEDCAQTGCYFSMFDRVFPLHSFPSTTTSLKDSLQWYSWYEDVPIDMETFANEFGDGLVEVLALEAVSDIVGFELSEEQRASLTEEEMSLFTFLQSSHTLRIAWTFVMGVGCEYGGVNLVENGEIVEMSETMDGLLTLFAENWVANYGHQFGPGNIDFW